MSKDPAFLFYPGDWLGGTMLMNRSHKGAYMDILMAQFNNGHLAFHEIETILGPDFESMWEAVLKSKFKTDSDGKFFNEKLEKEIVKRKNFSKKQTDRIKERWNKNTETVQNNIPNIYHGITTVIPFLENENENENRIVIKEGGTGGVVFYDLEKVYDELIKSQTWIESICRYVKNQTPETLNLKIREFVDMLKAKENTGKTLRQYKEYFTNWMKYDNEKSTGRKFEGDFRVSVGVQNFTETE